MMSVDPAASPRSGTRSNHEAESRALPCYFFLRKIAHAQLIYCAIRYFRITRSAVRPCG